MNTNTPPPPNNQQWAPPQQQQWPSPPPQAPKKDSTGKTLIKAGLGLTVLCFFLLFVGSCVAIVVAGSAAEGEQEASDTTEVPTTEVPTTTPPVTEPPSTEPPVTEAPAPEVATPYGPEWSEIVIFMDMASSIVVGEDSTICGLLETITVDEFVSFNRAEDGSYPDSYVDVELGKYNIEPTDANRILFVELVYISIQNTCDQSY